MSKNSQTNKELNVIAFLFDSGKIDNYSYGNVIFENFIKGKELVSNSNKIIFSYGDIFDKNIYDDINPFVIHNEICTVEKCAKQYSDYVFAYVLEDIETHIAVNIDSRLKSTMPAYLGMTLIDVQSTDSRKQFWKDLIRGFSIERETITFFGQEEQGMPFDIEKIKAYGFKFNYDGFMDECECFNNGNLFSTRQSSFIKSMDQLKIINGKNDSDRGISEMNFSLVKEVEIAGVQIWKAIEDINCVYIPENGNDVVSDYIFTSLYQASQGTERLLKIIIELIAYNNDSIDKKHTNNLLLGHNHVEMFNFVSEITSLSLNKPCTKLLHNLFSFYSKARYNRFHYSSNNIIELELIRDMDRNINGEDYNEKIKHSYGKALSQTAQKFYNLIWELSHKLHMFVYELHSESVSNYVFNNCFGNDLYETLKRIELSKKEVLWYLMVNGYRHLDSQITSAFPTLLFDECEINYYIHDLITNGHSCNMLYEFVSDQYDEMIEQNKEKWKIRIEAIGNIIGNQYFLT